MSTHPQYLSKSNFMTFLGCPEALWVDLHEPALRKPLDEVGEDTIQQGFEVESLAADLFPGVRTINTIASESMYELTLHAMASTTPRPIAQASFISPRDCLVKVDFLQWDPVAETWDVYEVKASTKVDKKHLQDLAFQRFTLEECGVKVGRTFLVLLVKGEVSVGAWDANKLLTAVDVTDEVSEVLVDREAYAAQVEAALSVVRDNPEAGGVRPASCRCWLKSGGDRCDHFRLLNPEIPAYSIYDVRVNYRKAAEFYPPLHEAGLHSIEDLPPEFLPLAGTKASLITRYAERKVDYDLKAIGEALGALTYPLYFLDYETAKWALPRYDGTCSYQQIPFQYSLHTLTAPPGDPKSELLHSEFLARDRDCPIPLLVESMARDIGPVGSVIVWNKSFEMTRNKEMAAFCPDYSDFLLDVNERVYDLMEVFQKDLYFDWRFQGSYSIKNVLPVLCPELSYKGMEVSNGGEAMTRWPRVVFGDNVNPEERERTFQGLLEYCGLDTYAMVAIFEVLYGLTRGV